MKIKTLIVDDEKPARDRLARLIGPISSLDLVGEAENAELAMLMILDLQPQLIFLDISMPIMSGIQLADWIQKESIDTHVIFTTAYDEYALEAFEVNAKDYLLKPIRRERLVSAIKKLIPKQVESEFIVLKDSKSTQKVLLDDIIYLHADQKYTEIHLNDMQLLSSDSLKDFEQKYPEHFLRIHRSTLINKQFLMGLEHLNNSMHVVLKDCESKPEVSRRHQPELRKYLKA